MRHLKAVLSQTGVVLLLTLALLEAVVAFSFAYPAASPIPLPLLRMMYQRFDRHVIQVMPECARYDARVTYTLRPGTCTFANREFRNTYHINSLGVRDDEASLQAPQMIVLGDSLAMGWGVEQEQTFPAVLERLTERRVLNAGISSFGTVRELRLLERIDRSRLEQVIIQYSDNDASENEAFVKSGNLGILSATQYARTVDEHQDALRYMPGKYAFNVLVQLRAAATRRAVDTASMTPAAERWQWQAALFVEVLKRSPVDLRAVKLTVISLHSDFIDALRSEVARSSVPWIASMALVDTQAVMQFPGAFYVLDDHPTAAGHDVIARALVAAGTSGGVR